ncbi:nucleotidyltransferase domain-containing protein [Hwanghaeella grinnelliae]|uniref:Nucleotidyltransferase domain-containing protein n=1 Tax=Hwanghaeella grinnelliae TaxID=2500179 RepID=A0A437QL38_9PROT|nr:nucleotidyltransferase domain-containing protein [Hwanghaeella grinnelliae]RVU35224.1 nucleotidyltransferase domain-containing protein [Hwanghaeella grinnelliae]
MQEKVVIPAAVRAEIETRLANLASEEGARLLMAVESGSRAWGFPSPDSDYDVRFLYVRPRNAYLSLMPPRDVIERPIVDEIDLNGWDIRKALALLLKHNAVLSEWMDSPVRYVVDDPVIGKLSDLATRHFNPRGYAKHYANLGRGAVSRWFNDDGTVSAKRYFYALRPALSVRALRLDPGRRPPMNILPLMEAAQVEQAVVDQIHELIARKAQTREAGNTIQLPSVERLIEDELQRVSEVPERPRDDQFMDEAEALFLQLVNEE